VSFSEPYIVYNLAGNGSDGYWGDGGPATSAELNFPYGVAVSLTDEVYIADTNNNRIRIVYSNGTIDTFAGNGEPAYSGDGGPATSAHISFPRGVTVSLTGEVYIADTYNSRIRVIYTNSTIYTFAGNGIAGYSGDGGPATSAEINSPYDVEVSSTGDVYIVDNGNQRIRIVYTNGTIDTFAGNGGEGYSGDGGPATSAQLSFPRGVAVSSTGEVYIADTGNNCIRVVYKNNTINTLIGNGSPGKSFDGESVKSAQLHYPTGVAVSSTDSVYIADYSNNAIRIVVNSTSSQCFNSGYYLSGGYCICSRGYTGELCQYGICFGLNSSIPDVCSGHGSCVSVNNCNCSSFYTGYMCQLNICYGINQTSQNVCSGQGNCTSPNNCQCNHGYSGYMCQLSICYGINATSSNVCSGHGECRAPNKCVCRRFYEGNMCQKNKLLYLNLLLLVIPVIVLIMALIAWFLWLFKRGFLEVRKKEKKEKELFAKLLEYEMAEKESDSVKLVRTNLKINLDELNFITKISEGAGGIVYKGIWYHQTVAIKKLKVSDEQSFVREVSVLNRLRHPNILELYGYSVDSRGYQYIITEFMEKGSLDSLIYSNSLKDFRRKIRSLLNISHGMRFIHERNIIHRDLKPQNVLVNRNNVCKLCDFGLAKVRNETLTIGVIGTWQYMAPEIMTESEDYNEKCDVYSFGIIMHELFTLSKPYMSSDSEHINQFTLGMKIINGSRPSIPSEVLSDKCTEDIASHITEYFFKTNELPMTVTSSSIDIVLIVKKYFELCRSCWSDNPAKRPVFEQIIIKLEDIEKLLPKETIF